MSYAHIMHTLSG